jgi:sarcosine oxidase
VRAQLERARAHRGTVLKFGERVLSWESDGHTARVRTDAGGYAAGSLVLAPGAWSAELIGPLPLPLTVRRGPQFWFNPRPGRETLEQGPCFAFAVGGAFVYGFPSVVGMPVKVANYAPSAVIAGDPLARDPLATEAELAPVAAAVARHLPGVDPQPAGQHVCMYTLTPDENFIVDRHPEHANVFLFTGDSGHAFKFAPVLGLHLARLAVRVKTAPELDFLKLAGRSSGAA